MIERMPWYTTEQRIQPDDVIGRFSAYLIVDDDTGTIEIEISFRIEDTRPEFTRHETAVRIRAQIVNEIFLTYLILKALTAYAICIGCEIYKETAPIVYDIYKSSCERRPNLGFKERTRDVLNQLKETTAIDQGKKAAISALLPCARDIARNPF
jgi:hypothetical protein